MGHIGEHADVPQGIEMLTTIVNNWLYKTIMGGAILLLTNFESYGNLPQNCTLEATSLLITHCVININV